MKSFARSPRPAAFLDRDGVLIEDRELLVCAEEFRILPGVPEALRRLHEAGYLLIIVTNQAVVARGLISESDLATLHAELSRRLEALGAPPFTAVYACPHHPHANIAAYRINCACRKPRPGLILRAAAEHEIDLARSVMIGDRPTDVWAGRAAGCRTVLIEGPKTGAPAIVTIDPPPQQIEPDYRAASLLDALPWLLADDPSVSIPG